MQFSEAEPGATPAPAFLKGEVCSQYIRCRKPGCRCADGPPHGPYYYRVWREGNSVRKVYVKAADVESVRAACAAFKEFEHSLRDLRRARQEIMVGIRREGRRTRTLLNKT